MRHGTSALITWSSVAGARSYSIKVRGSDGRLETHFRKPNNRSVSLTNVLPFESFTATVTAVGGRDMLPGRSTTARLAPVRIHTRAPQRTPGKRGKGKKKR